MNTNNKSLKHSRLLHWILIIGVSLAVFIDFTYSFSIQEFLTCSGDNCTEEFVISSYVPSLILTLTITTAGFYALIFRSDQTTKQIAITTENNVFNNFVAHKKEFVELLESFEKDTACTIKNKRGLYKSLFPDNCPTKMSFECDKVYLMELIKIDNNSKTSLLDRLDRSDSTEKTLFAFEVRIIDLSNHFEITMNSLLQREIIGIAETKNLPRKLSDSIELVREMYQLIADFSIQNKATEFALNMPHVLSDENYFGMDLHILNFQAKLSEVI
ncbi:hypothetical protein [uncultured Psychromonas sp.]|uniref:hypothetical protein n=1 Tax=uncultured Psychromonas sp. TaxID=173974 RepID=UPI00262303EE|nr:hypothetical protein [uncultured Psychromonas sp.]